MICIHKPTASREYQKRHLIAAAAILYLSGLASACTIITDFDESKIKVDFENELNAEDISIESAVPANAAVTDTENLARIVFHFDGLFDIGDASTLDSLFGEALTLTIKNSRSTVGEAITVSRVNHAPQNPGEFELKMGDRGQLAVVTFYNRNAGDAIVSSGDTVDLIVYVDDNRLIEFGVFPYEIPVH